VRILILLNLVRGFIYGENCVKMAVYTGTSELRNLWDLGNLWDLWNKWNIYGTKKFSKNVP
jgi:hypothetical protein